jgi:hypothetical protein
VTKVKVNGQVKVKVKINVKGLRNGLWLRLGLYCLLGGRGTRTRSGWSGESGGDRRRGWLARPGDILGR